MLSTYISLYHKAGVWFLFSERDLTFHLFTLLKVASVGNSDSAWDFKDNIVCGAGSHLDEIIYAMTVFLMTEDCSTNAGVVEADILYQQLCADLADFAIYLQLCSSYYTLQL